MLVPHFPNKMSNDVCVCNVTEFAYLRIKQLLTSNGIIVAIAFANDWESIENDLYDNGSDALSVPNQGEG